MLEKVCVEMNGALKIILLSAHEERLESTEIFRGNNLYVVQKTHCPMIQLLFHCLEQL